jgi:hypothetical protein
MRPLLVAANVVPSSPILVTLMMEALSSSETSVLRRVTRRNIPEGAILLGAFSLTAKSSKVDPAFNKQHYVRKTYGGDEVS